jgi:hypothetical protein
MLERYHQALTIRTGSGVHRDYFLTISKIGLWAAVALDADELLLLVTSTDGLA